MAHDAHHAHPAHDPNGRDKSAGFIGLIVTATLIGLTMFAIVKLTNASFAGHKAEAATPAAAH
jgi:hypothetical protein